MSPLGGEISELEELFSKGNIAFVLVGERGRAYELEFTLFLFQKIPLVLRSQL